MLFFKKYKNLRQIKPYFKRYNPLIIALSFVMITASSMGMVGAYFMSEQMVGITNQITGQMIKYTLLLIAVEIIHIIFTFLWAKFLYILSGKVAKNIRSDIINKTLDIKYLCLKENSSGYYLERLNDDANEVSLFLPYVLGMLADVLINCGYLVLVFILNWQAALFFTIGIVFLLIIELIKVKKDLVRLTKVKDATEKSNSNLNEIARGIKDIKGLGIKAEMLAASDNLHENLRKVTMAKNTTFAFFGYINIFLQCIIFAGLILLSALWLFPKNQISVVVLLMIINYRMFMFDTVGAFSKIKQYYTQGDYRAGRILEIINNGETENFGVKEISLTTHEIEVRNLSFGYDKKLILDNINFKVKSNCCSVFIGASGSGKSTLFGLLSKLIDAENSKIFFGGFDINLFSENSFRSILTLINQEPFMFNNTIENNIKIVKPDAGFDEIILACKKANVHNEILNFTSGYQTVLSENGANLSTGQKQRIAIARAILKNTPIILFDEPTSALDKENQAIFFDVLKDLKQTKTILVIAHKLDSYEIFDNVFNLKNGKLNEGAISL